MRSLPILVVLLAALLAVPALAEPMPALRDLTSVRAAGMANATIGFAADTDAIHVNPAAICDTPHFALSIGTFLNVPHKQYLFSLEAVDSKINSDEAINVSGGVGYQYFVAGEGFESRKGHILALSLAAPMYKDYASVGITARYLKISGAVVSNAITMDASVMVKPIPMLGIAVAGYNLIDVHSPEAKRSWGMGVSVGKPNEFHADVDVRLDDDAAGKLQPTFSVGGEYLIAKIVAPRLGYSEDLSRKAHILAVGVSVIVDDWAIEASYRHAILGDEKNFGLALRLIDF